MLSIGIRIIIASSLFVASGKHAGDAAAAVPFYDGMVAGLVAQILHGAMAITNLVLTPIVLFKGVK